MEGEHGNRKSPFGPGACTSDVGGCVLGGVAVGRGERGALQGKQEGRS